MSVDNGMIIKCPNCHTLLSKSIDSVSCLNCNKSYNAIDKYYDLYIDNSKPADYTPKTEHLLFTKDKILSMQPVHATEESILYKYVIGWNNELEKLKKTLTRAGTSERSRVEFMVDDYTTEEFKSQEQFTERKAEIISEILIKQASEQGKVLHVGCGGFANRAIPLMYSKLGYLNYGVDAVRSYVQEFLEYGEAYLANATALPFADETFELVNFTDILEHLFDPLKGLQEASRVLKHKGFIILDTPIFSGSPTMNLISLLRRFIGKTLHRQKRPRVITNHWDGEVYFHTEFTKGEIEMLLSQADLKIIKITAEPIDKVSTKSRLKMIVTGARSNDAVFFLAQKK